MGGYPHLMVMRCIAVLALAAVYSAGTPLQLLDRWENLRDLRPGEGIEVVDMRMRSQSGRFAGHTQDSITVRQDGRDITVARAEVASVKRRQSHRRRNVLAGLAIGAATGLAAGTIHGKTYHEEGETAVFIAVWTPIGAGVGAVIGAALPAGVEVTVYRADVVSRPPAGNN